MLWKIAVQYYYEYTSLSLLINKLNLPALYFHDKKHPLTGEQYFSKNNNFYNAVSAIRTTPYSRIFNLLALLIKNKRINQ